MNGDRSVDGVPLLFVVAVADFDVAFVTLNEGKVGAGLQVALLVDVGDGGLATDASVGIGHVEDGVAIGVGIVVVGVVLAIVIGNDIAA